MGVIEFAKSVGRKLGIEDDTPPAQSPRGTNAQVRKAVALTMSIRQLGWPADDLDTHVEDDQVILAGTVDSQEVREMMGLSESAAMRRYRPATMPPPQRDLRTAPIARRAPAALDLLVREGETAA